MKLWEDILADRKVGVFGAAGTGKTFLIRAMVPYLQKLPKFQDPGSLVVVAATNTAAKTFGELCFGTMHSFFGVDLLELTVHEHVANIRNNVVIKKRILRATLVIVLEFFSLPDITKLSEILKVVRASTDFMGGLGLLPEGDFLQLPNPSTQEFVFHIHVVLYR